MSVTRRCHCLLVRSPSFEEGVSSMSVTRRCHCLLVRSPSFEEGVSSSLVGHQTLSLAYGRQALRKESVLSPDAVIGFGFPGFEEGVSSSLSTTRRCHWLMVAKL